MYRDDRVRQAFEMIEQGVKDVYTSDRFIEYLQMLSKFHNYSVNNVILIIKQYPNASLVAGYNSWRDNFNRHVNKGEKAIRILAPYEMLVKQEQEKPDHTKEIREVKVRKFRMVNVFDISQTSGEPLPELTENLKGKDDRTKVLIEAVKELSTTPIEYHSLEEDKGLQDGAKGYFDRSENKIVVLKDMEEKQICKTLVHEYAHSILHQNSDHSREQKEIEAESIAFVICNHFGIDTSDYSFAYIATFAMNNEQLLKDTLISIQSAAKNMINEIEPIFEKHLEEYKDLTSDKDYRLTTPVELEKISSSLIDDLFLSISKSDFFEVLKSSIGTSDLGVDVLQETVLTEMKNLQPQYPELYELYRTDPYYKTGLEMAVLSRCNGSSGAKDEFHPFIETSMERQLYEQFEVFAKPILDNSADYMALDTLFYDDISIERLDENRIAISKHYELNGDLMADPDVEMIVDQEHKLLYPQTYQHDEDGMYKDINDEPEYKADLGLFMTKWFEGIPGSHYKINRIMGEGFDLTDHSNRKEIYDFCKTHDIEKMAKRVTEKKQHEL